MTNQELIQKIKNLETIKPRAEYKEFSRDILLSQIRMMEPTQVVKIEPPAKAFSWRFYYQTWREIFVRRAMQPAVVLLLLLGLVLASSLTVNAAFYSLPGEALYPIKISLEKTQLALERDEVSRTELRMEFAKKRVEELNKVVAQPEEPRQKSQKISLVVDKFKAEVASVKSDIQQLKQNRKPVFQIAMSVDSATTELAEALDKNSENLAAEDKAVVQEAADSAEETGISALATLVNSATTTIDQLAESDLTESLSQKITNLEAKIEQANLSEEQATIALKLVAEAEVALAETDFNQVLAKISQIKDLIKESKQEESEPINLETESAVESATLETSPQEESEAIEAGSGSEPAVEANERNRGG